MCSSVATLLTSYRWEMGPKLNMRETENGPTAGGPWRGRVPKWPKNGWANGRTGRKWPNSICPAICLAIFRPLFGSQKRLKPKNLTNSTKKSSEQFEGLTGHYPAKTRFWRQIAPESSPEPWAKSLITQFLCGTFLFIRANRPDAPYKNWVLIANDLRESVQPQPQP